MVTRRATDQRRGGFTYLEVLIASAIITTVVAAGLNVLTMQAAHRSDLESLARANELASAMVAEMDGLAFEEPDYAVAFGPEDNGYETEVTAPPSRLNYDDIDDYDGWDAEPPQSKDGVPLSGAEAYRRKVTLGNVSEDDLETDVDDGASDVKRITVKVLKDGEKLVELVRFRTRAQGEVAP